MSGARTTQPKASLGHHSGSALLAGEADTLECGACLGRCLEQGALIFLRGALGAGKTTLVRGILRGRGYGGAVRSPSYVLMEDYDTEGLALLHCDLYRLRDAGELEFLGLREYLQGDAAVLVEWPERGAHWFPRADLCLALHGGGHSRRLAWRGGGPRGRALASCLADWAERHGRA